MPTQLECVFVDNGGRDHSIDGYSRKSFTQMKTEPAKKTFAIKDANFRNDRIPYLLAVTGALFFFLFLSLFILLFGFDDEEETNINIINNNY